MLNFNMDQMPPDQGMIDHEKKRLEDYLHKTVWITLLVSLMLLIVGAPLFKQAVSVPVEDYTLSPDATIVLVMTTLVGFMFLGVGVLRIVVHISFPKNRLSLSTLAAVIVNIVTVIVWMKIGYKELVAGNLLHYPAFVLGGALLLLPIYFLTYRLYNLRPLNDGSEAYLRLLEYCEKSEIVRRYFIQLAEFKRTPVRLEYSRAAVWMMSKERSHNKRDMNLKAQKNILSGDLERKPE